MRGDGFLKPRRREAIGERGSLGPRDRRSLSASPPDMVIVRTGLPFEKRHRRRTRVGGQRRSRTHPGSRREKGRIEDVGRNAAFCSCKHVWRRRTTGAYECRSHNGVRVQVRRTLDGDGRRRGGRRGQWTPRHKLLLFGQRLHGCRAVPARQRPGSVSVQRARLNY